MLLGDNEALCIHSDVTAASRTKEVFALTISDAGVDCGVREAGERDVGVGDVGCELSHTDIVGAVAAADFDLVEGNGFKGVLDCAAMTLACVRLQSLTLHGWWNDWVLGLPVAWPGLAIHSKMMLVEAILGGGGSRGVALFMLERREVDVLEDAGVDVEALRGGVQFFDERGYAASWAEVVDPAQELVCHHRKHINCSIGSL